MVITENPDDVFFRDAPTLVDAVTVFGRKVAVSWLYAAVVNVSEFCGVRERMTEQQGMEVAELILGEHFYLKMTEFLLFCRRFKAGRYLRFYGSFDPQSFMASIRMFLADRNSAYARQQQEEYYSKIKTK